YFLAPAIGNLFATQPFISAFFIVLLSALICAVIGMLIELLAYRPLRNRPRLTVLITAIGMSLFIEYTGQHRKVLGAETKPFPKLLPQRDFHLGALHVDSNDVVVLIVTTLLLAALWFIVQRTKTGMAMRAVAFNERAAALMGVNINRIISF